MHPVEFLGTDHKLMILEATMGNRSLDYFGKALMQSVRDESIEQWDMIITGRMKSITARKIQSIFTSFSEEQVGIVNQIVPEIVDTTLHYLLWTLEQEMSINIAVEVDGGIIPSIRDVSDGLAGELYTEDGWIARFSSYPSLME